MVLCFGLVTGAGAATRAGILLPSAEYLSLDCFLHRADTARAVMERCRANKFPCAPHVATESGSGGWVNRLSQSPRHSRPKKSR
jgi:hypothetical protein